MERVTVKDNILGNALVMEDSSEGLLSRGLAEMDPRERCHYEQALAEARDLVETESNFVYFLRAENFHVSRAAARLCRYWKYRKLIFGSNRWLLPLNQTGQGALSLSDLEVLHTGYLVLQPRPYPQGPVLITDISRLRSTAGFAETRCVFYLCNVFPEEFCHPDGITLVSVTTTAPRNPQTVEKDVALFVLTGLPIRVKKTLITQACEEPGKEILVQSMAEQHARIVEFRTGARPQIIPSNSIKGTLQDLAQQGVQRDYLPRCLGGYFDYSRFYDWIRMRLSIEDVMGAAPTFVNNFSIASPMQEPLLTGTTTATRTPPCGALPALVSTKTDSSKRPVDGRRMNTCTRRNKELKSLKEQVASLEVQNRNIRNDNRRLEGYLSQARLLVACLHAVPVLH